MANQEDIVELLARVPVFETLGEDDLQRVAEVAVPRRFAAGQVIFREGDDSDTCYIVRTGHARAIREHPDGRTITLAHFGPGDIFGELAMFDDERRSATVEAVDDVEASRSSAPTCAACCASTPTSRSSSSSRSAAACARPTSASRASPSRPSRAASPACSASSSSRPAPRAPATRDVLVTITQADIAQLAGSSRESASRFLAVARARRRRHPGPRPDHRPRPGALERYVY